MQRKTIKALLGKTVKTWAASIKDEDLAKEAKDNCIVTGGAITSLLLNETPNDYDIYFTNFSTAKKIAAYYRDQFIAQNNGNAGGIELRTVNKPNIKGETEQRVEFFIRSDGVAKAAKKKKLKPYSPIFISPNAISLSKNIQLIIRFYGEPADIHKNYDFVHATCSYKHSSQDLTLPPAALESILNRHLYYTGSLYPIASYFRTRKFLERGWRVSIGEMLKIAWQISELDLTNHEILTDQLIGVDVTYLIEFINAVQNVDPKKLNSTYIAAILDKIFN